MSPRRAGAFGCSLRLDSAPWRRPPPCRQRSRRISPLKKVQTWTRECMGPGKETCDNDSFPVNSSSRRQAPRPTSRKSVEGQPPRTSSPFQCLTGARPVAPRRFGVERHGHCSWVAVCGGCLEDAILRAYNHRAPRYPAHCLAGSIRRPSSGRGGRQDRDRMRIGCSRYSETS